MRKAVFTTNGPEVRITVPFAKVDQEQRTVSGFATMDNRDSHGDVVTADASALAFARWRGNLREMHAPIAVGKVLGFTQEDFYDAESDQFYRGIFVTAYVSKGAEDTWEKVLDGTLSGFSIGGKVLADEERFNAEAGKTVRYITDYEMVELSLVDNPANQLCNVFSIVKNQDGSSMMKGMAVDVRTENILYCPTDEFVITTTREAAECAKCAGKMENIGWVESDAADKVEVTKSLIAKRKGLSAPTIKGSVIQNGNLTWNGNLPTNTSTGANGYTINFTTGNGVDVEKVAEKVAELLKNSQTLEGGVDVADNDKTEGQVEENQASTEAADNEEVVTPTEEAATATEETEKAAEVDEVEQDEVDLTKMFSEFTQQIQDVVKNSLEETKTVVQSVKTELEETVKSLGTQVSELNEKFGALEAKTEGVAKRVDSVEDDTAVKKSSDLGGSGKTEEKPNSFWRGSFLGTNDLLS